MKDIRNIIANYRKTFRILWKVDAASVLFLLISVTITGIIPTLSTVIMQHIMNLITSPQREIQTLALYIGLYIGCDAILEILNLCTTYVTSIYEKKITLDLDAKILNKVKSLDLKHFEDSESYNKIQRAQAENGGRMFNYFLSATSVIQYVTMLIGAGVILLSWNAWSILLVSVAAFVNTAFMLKINKYQFEVLRKRTGEEREKWYYQYILTNDIAFKEIKIYGLHDFFLSKYKKIAQAFLKQDQKIAKRTAGIGSIRVVLEQMADVVILGSIFWDAFRKVLKVGDTIAYIRSVANIKSNMNGLLMQSVGIYKDTLYINQLFEFLELPVQAKQENLHHIDRIWTIQICNLSYRYKNAEHKALKNVNLNLNLSEHITLVGKNGSGKSTLVKILAGFYDDYEGDIYVNGMNLRDIDLDSLRKKIGLLFQDYNKYEMSVRENVCVGNLELLKEDDRIREALQRSDAPEKLCGDLDQQLGYWFKSGCQLSGGEWLKVGISRVLLKDADFYMLDEPNAALDPIGEAKVMEGMKKIVEGKLSIFITHRIHHVEKLPGKIVVLDQGEIVDIGLHKDLLSRCSVYREMFEKSAYEEKGGSNV